MFNNVSCEMLFFFFICLLSSTAMSPASAGVLGNFSKVSFILSLEIGILTCFYFIADHLDTGRENIFWKMILLAIREFSRSVSINPLLFLFLSVWSKLKQFLTLLGGNFPFLKYPKQVKQMNCSSIFFWM